MSETRVLKLHCDCPAGGNLDPMKHADECVMFACYACGAKTLLKVEHAEDCADRCAHCRSEGWDNDHKADCPTLGTCAQYLPGLPREQWHPEPPDLPGEKWGEWWRQHEKLHAPCP